MNHQLIRILHQLHLLYVTRQLILCEPILNRRYCAYIDCENCPLADTEDYPIHYTNYLNEVITKVSV